MEWYLSNPWLQKTEIEAMNKLYPDAKRGYLPDDRMYWTIILRPVIFGEEKEWTLLAVYDSDHPHKKWGGSVKIYPVRPNFNEMQEMVNNASVNPKKISHLLIDNDRNIYLASCVLCNRKEYNNENESATLAVTQIQYALRWITIFEVGLVEQKVWSVFSGSGYGNTYEYICNHFSYIPDISHLS